jgi:hypothetical protein
MSSAIVGLDASVKLTYACHHLVQAHRTSNLDALLYFYVAAARPVDRLVQLILIQDTVFQAHIVECVLQSTINAMQCGRDAQASWHEWCVGALSAFRPRSAQAKRVSS